MCDVNIISGEVYHFSRDFHLPGPIPFVFERSYNSSALRDGPLGWGWQLSLDVIAECDSQKTLLTWDDGTPLPLPGLDVGQRISDAATGLSLRRDASTLIVTTADLSEMHLVDAGEAGRYILSARIDPFGNQVLYDRHYLSGRVGSVRDSCGRRIELTYDFNGHLSEVWLREPVSMLLLQLQYTSAGDLAAVTDRTGVQFAYDYDKHLLVGYTNRIGGSVYYQYDAKGKCTRSWRSDGWLRVMRRDPEKKMVLVTDSKGNHSIIDYDDNGNMVRMSDAAGIVSENSYNRAGQLIYSSGNPGAAGESQIFDADNRVLTSIVGSEQNEIHYDDMGFPAKLIDPEGRVSEYIYDRGLLRTYKSPAETIWTFDYDERGELRSFSMPNGRVIRRVVSSDWCEETITDNYGLIEKLTYDELGRVVAFEGPEESKTRFQYGQRSESITASLPDGNVVSYEYDADGNLVRETDELGQVTEYEFTPFGLLASTIRAGGWRLQRAYDTEGNTVKVTSPAGFVAEMAYNTRNQMTWLRSFDGRETQFDYDEQNRLASCTELPSATKVRYTYGSQSERADYSDGTFIETESDTKGNVLRICNESCELKFEWDREGRLIGEKRGDDWVRYRHDGLGNVVSVSSSWGTELSYSWDLRGRVVSAKSGTRSYQFGYDGRDLLTSCLWPNGAQERLEYDAVDRLIETRVENSSGREVHRISYDYDPADRLASVSCSDGSRWDYFYDVLGRVARVRRNGVEFESYRYDLDGNSLILRDGTPILVELGGRIRPGNGRVVAYDDSGRISMQTRNGRSTSYRYNALGQLVTVADDRNNITNFAYDGLGRRIRKTSFTGHTTYLWTSLAPLAERSDAETIEYLFLPGSFFLKGSESRESFSFLSDHLGSPVAAFSVSQAEPVKVERTLWAELTSAPSPPDGMPQIGRLGQYWDEETELYYNWHRYFDPALNRYLQPDPLDISGGLNLYMYPDEPLRAVDPFGLYTCRIKMNECWNESQEEDARKKLARLNEKKKQNKNRRKPGRCTYQTAAERWKYCKDKGRLTQDQLKEKRRFRLPCKIQHIDHILEKQLRGGDDCDNLQALNAKVNMSFGAQIFRCRKNAGFRTPSSFQFYKTKTIPCKPGEEC